jgi:hypothetical protein
MKFKVYGGDNADYVNFTKLGEVEMTDDEDKNII